MIALDTNILVRYDFDDADPQRDLAIDLIDRRCSPEEPAFVSLVVLVEFAWVVLQRLKRTKAELVTSLRALLDNPHLTTERTTVVEGAVEDYADGSADFADYVIGLVGVVHGAAPTLTFDRRAGREPGFTLLKAS